jgi:hypothetical protein
MLWYANDPKMSLTAKIMSGLEYYKTKYEKTANQVYVHPSALKSGDVVSIPGVTVLTHRSVLPNHFWIGVADVSKGK